VELGAELVLVAGLNLFTSWTYSDFRYVSYSDSVGRRVFVLDGRPLPGIPQHWLHLLVQARPGFARGGWAELEETHSSGFVVDDTLNTATGTWWTTNVRLGWDGSLGALRVRPFVGFNNVFNRAYVSSVVINASGGRYYEPAPGRNLYVGCSLAAGE
jgi:iron complex outermembrane receptor protein